MKINSKTLLNLSLQNEPNRKPKGVFPLLSIDYGVKHTGLAYSPDGICSIPLKTIHTEKLSTEIYQCIQTYSIQKIIVGMPLEKNGTKNTLCKEIHTFFAQQKFTIPIEFVNERFSSQNTLFAGSKKQRIDDLAAAQILEFYFAQKD